MRPCEGSNPSATAINQSKVQCPRSNVNTGETDIGLWTLDIGLSFDPELERQSSGLLSREVRVQVPSGQPILCPKSNVQSPTSILAKQTLDIGLATLDSFRGVAQWQSTRSIIERRRFNSFHRDQNNSPKSKVQRPKSPMVKQTLDFGHWTLDTITGA